MRVASAILVGQANQAVGRRDSGSDSGGRPRWRNCLSAAELSGSSRDIVILIFATRRRATREKYECEKGKKADEKHERSRSGMGVDMSVNPVGGTEKSGRCLSLHTFKKVEIFSPVSVHVKLREIYAIGSGQVDLR